MGSSFHSTSTVRASLLLLLLPFAADADLVLTEGTNLSVDVADDGRVAFDLLGGLWTVPQKGGVARAHDTGALRVREPRWSPDAVKIAFSAERDGLSQCFIYDVDRGSVDAIGSSGWHDADAAWHPDGTRITVSSSRSDADADLFDVDIATGLRWRLTTLPGAETDPAWSSDGRDLIYVHEHEGRWSLMLRRFGEPDRSLLTSEHRLSSPSWRPDGSLISYLRHDDGIRIHMLILSDPMLDRELVADTDIFDTPVAWRDRQNLVYAANGKIRRRDFNSWIPRSIPFRARLQRPPPATGQARARPLPTLATPEKSWVLRVSKAYTGAARSHQQAVDIVIRGGTIAAVEAQRERDSLPVIDLGDVTAVPGFIDAYAALPDTVDESAGPLLLSLGITTLVTRHPRIEALNATWSGEDVPGPRLLAYDNLDTLAPNDTPWLVAVSGNPSSEQLALARQLGAPILADSWQTFLNVGASLVLGSQSSPTSPAGLRYQDVQTATRAGPFSYVSAMAGQGTPGIEALRSLRQADRLSALGTTPVRAAGSTRPGSARLVLGSRPNRYPPGLATVAELVAIGASGRPGYEVLDAAGANAARSLRLEGQLGSLVPGAAADIVVLAADPLERRSAVTSVVAVVRNGRFFSAVGLIDRSQ